MPKRVEPLDVWLYGERLAQLTQPNSGRIHYRLEFTEEALDTYGEGRRILSLALPISRTPVTDAVGGSLPVTHFRHSGCRPRISWRYCTPLAGTAPAPCNFSVRMPMHRSRRFVS